MKKVFIIAEAGVNHNGSFELAKKLVDKAVEAGVDCVKFQTFKAENLVNSSAKKAEYQVENTGTSDSQFNMLKKLELSYEQFKKLKRYCDNKKIMFLSTPFDLESADFLNALGLKIFKIPSGEITNLPYLRKCTQAMGESSAFSASSTIVSLSLRGFQLLLVLYSGLKRLCLGFVQSLLQPLRR